MLARAGRTGITRDKILALLWPDEPEDRARRSLNQAVYSLRRDLGADDALVGSKDLRLNLDSIHVDVVAFDDAIAAGDFDGAVREYGGPFLDGFFLPRADEFERWAENERRTLAAEYSRALERVATRASDAGDSGAALVHWRKLAAGDPLNARIALSVMRALVAVGDTSGAIQHARLHEVLLGQELGLPPDREVAALARRLRADADRSPAATEPEAANLYATHTEIRLLLAEAYWRGGRRDRANAQLARVRFALANADAPVRARAEAVIRSFGASSATVAGSAKPETPPGHGPGGVWLPGRIYVIRRLRDPGSTRDGLDVGGAPRGRRRVGL